MKVAICENAIGFGGSTVCAQHLVRACTDAGIDPFLVLSYPTDRLGQNETEDHTYRLDHSRLWRTGLALRHNLNPKLSVGNRVWGHVGFATAWYGCEWPTALRLSRWLKAHRIDIVHANNDLLNNRLAILASRLAGIPVISHQRGRQWPARFARRMARFVSRFVAISDFIYQDLSDCLGSQERMTRIYDGVPLIDRCQQRDQVSRDIRQTCGFRPEHIVFGMPGMFVSWKGQPLFLKAFSKVAQRRNDVRALIVGDDPRGKGEAKRQLHQLVAALNIQDKVVISGMAGNIEPYLRAMDVVVHASTQPEPLGLTVLEAMAAGKPVIAADQGGPTETVIPGQTGELFKTGDTDQLAACMWTMLSRENQWNVMGENGRHRVETHFSLKQNQQAIVRLYSEVCRQRRDHRRKGVECQSRPCYS